MHFAVVWDLHDDDGNIQHIEEHGLSRDEVEDVLDHPDDIAESRSTGRIIAFGTTRTGRSIAVVFEEIDGLTIRPITAFEIEE